MLIFVGHPQTLGPRLPSGKPDGFWRVSGTPDSHPLRIRCD
jgi:hypothetical protein